MPRRILFLLGIECFAAGVCITQPFFGTLFLVLLVFTRPQDDRPNMVQLHYQGVIFLSVLLGTLCRFDLVQARVGRAFRGVRLMFLLLVIMWLSAMANGYTPQSAYQVGEFATLTLFCSILVLWVDSPQRFALTVGTLVCSAIYLVQLVIRNPRMIQEQIGGEQFERVFFRALVNWGNPNFQAIFMIIAIYLALSLFAANLRVWMKPAILGGLVGFVYVFLKCQSRGATLALVISFPVFWLFQKRKALIGGATVALLFIGFAFFAPETYITRLLTIVNYEQDTSATSRLELWSVAMDLIRAHPLTGIGPGNFRMYTFSSQHNSYLQTASDIGVPGLIVYVSCLAFGLFHAFSARNWAGPKRNNIPVVFSLAGGLAASIVAIIVQGFFTGFAFREFVYTSLILSFIAKCIAREYVAPAVTVAPVGATTSRFKPAFTAAATLIGGHQTVNLARASYTQAQAGAQRLRHSPDRRGT